MKVFILEDDPLRIKWFKRKFIGTEIEYTDNVKDAKKILENENFDTLFLDHDLGGQVFVSCEEENTGSGLANWIVNTNRKYETIVIHSMNPIGSHNMKCILTSSANRVISVPFCNLESVLK